MSSTKCLITFKNIEHTNGILRFIGAQQKMYLALSGNGTCCIISARNLKSSVLHIKYRESSTVLRDTKISWKRMEYNLINKFNELIDL